MIQEYIEYDFTKRYITVTDGEALYKVCYPLEDEEEGKRLSILIEGIDTKSILEMEIVDGSLIENYRTNDFNKVPYLYVKLNEFLEKVFNMCNYRNGDYENYRKAQMDIIKKASNPETLKKRDDFLKSKGDIEDSLKMAEELFDKMDIQKRDSKRIPPFLHLLEHYWMMEGCDQLRFYQLIHNLAHRIKPDLKNIDELYNVEDDVVYEALSEAYDEILKERELPSLEEREKKEKEKLEWYRKFRYRSKRGRHFIK